MARRIVSQTDDSTTEFPSLDLPIQIYLEEDETIDGTDYKEGDVDPRYPSKFDVQSIYLVTIDNRRYDSVHEDYTDEILAATEDNDFQIETELDGNFVNTVMRYNTLVAKWIKEDDTVISSLGLPEYDPETDTGDLKTALIDASIYEASDAYLEELESIVIEEVDPEPIEEEELANYKKSIQDAALAAATESEGEAISVEEEEEQTDSEETGDAEEAEPESA
jgi:hypothetical protein